VPQEYIDAVKGQLTPTVKAMVDLQLLTGARPGEIRTMKTCEIDTSTPVWHYRPSSHKTAHHAIDRDIPIGKQAQKILKRLLRPDLQAFIFSPADAEAERLEARRKARKSPMTPSQARRAELAAKRDRRRPPKDHYTKDSYRRAVMRACGKAFDSNGERQEAGEEIERFAPNQLRHNAATLVRKLFGLDAAKAVLGHKTTRTTEVYAEIDRATAEKVVSEVG
jgi:integrase